MLCKCGCPLVLDTTCADTFALSHADTYAPSHADTYAPSHADTFAPSHAASACKAAGEVARQAEHRKREKYLHLDPTHIFLPFVAETTGVLGEEALFFLQELATRIRSVTGEPNSFQYLLQRISVIIQKRNAASILGTAKIMDDIFSDLC